MKNYLLMVNEEAMQYLKAISPSFQFVEVRGMNIKEFPNDTFLTTAHVEAVQESILPSDAIVEEIKSIQE